MEKNARKFVRNCLPRNYPFSNYDRKQGASNCLRESPSFDESEGIPRTDQLFIFSVLDIL